jgi:hypothetical protein
MSTSETINIGDLVYDQRDISPALLDVTSRQINDWINSKIVPFTELPVEDDSKNEIEAALAGKVPPRKTKWMRLNLAQAVWVSIVRELFKLNIPLETLQELSKKVWQAPRAEKYADEVFKYHIEKNPNGFPDEELNKLKSRLKDELLMEYYYRTILNPFTDMIKSVIDRRGMPHTMLYVPKTSDYDFRYDDNSLIIDLSSVYLQHPMISLPMNPIISQVLAIDFENNKKDLPYLTDVERQIRDIVVFKRPKVVEIAFEDDHIKPIVVTEEHKSREELAEYILRHKIAKGSKLLIDIRSQDNYKITLIKK